MGKSSSLQAHNLGRFNNVRRGRSAVAAVVSRSFFSSRQKRNDPKFGHEIAETLLCTPLYSHICCNVMLKICIKFNTLSFANFLFWVCFFQFVKYLWYFCDICDIFFDIWYFCYFCDGLWLTNTKSRTKEQNKIWLMWFM